MWVILLVVWRLPNCFMILDQKYLLVIKRAYDMSEWHRTVRLRMTPV